MDYRRGIYSIFVYIFLYIIFNYGLSVTFHYFGDSLKSFFDVFSFLPQTYKFLFLFVFQEVVLLAILGISFYYWWLEKIGRLFKNIYFYYKKRFVWRGWHYMFKYSIGFFLIYMFGIALLNIIFQNLGVNIPGFFGEQKVATFLSKIQLNNFFDYFILFISVAVVGPFIEELIYRGFITDISIKKFGANVGIIFSAFLFAIAHFEWQVVGNLFILSLILSYIYYKTGSLCYTFIFHFIVNFMGVLALFLTSGS